MDIQNTGNAASVEIVNCIREAGLTPDQTDLTQLAKAVKALGGGSVRPDLPNLEFGVETRWPLLVKGKQVYARLMDCGTLPYNAEKKMEHGIPNVDWIKISYDFSRVWNESGYMNGCVYAINDGSNFVTLVSKTHIRIIDKSKLPDTATSSVELCLLYTKTTDPVIA